MTPIKIKINDSISLMSIKTDKFKTGMLAATLSLPLSKKIAAYNMLLSGVLRRGCKKYPLMALLNRRLDELYASEIDIKNARMGKNSTFMILADILNNSLVDDGTDVFDGVLDVISGLISDPIASDAGFPAETVEKEKRTLLDAIDAEMNNPRVYALEKCAELMHIDSEEFPSVEDLREIIRAADGKSLYAHYQRLISECRLNFFYVGEESVDEVAERIKKHFSSFCGFQIPLVMPISEPFGKLKEVTEPFDVTQGKLCLGFRLGVCAGDEDYFAAVLFNEIFGGSPASKLFMNVREKMSLCYYCSSSYDTYLGNVTVSSGINVEDVELAREQILNQLEDIRRGEISDVEFTAAKNSIANWYRQMYDFPAELFAFYSTRALLGIEASPSDYMKKFDGVTKEMVVKIAKNVMLDTVYFLKGTLSEDEEEFCDD